MFGVGSAHDIVAGSLRDGRRSLWRREKGSGSGPAPPPLDVDLGERRLEIARAGGYGRGGSAIERATLSAHEPKVDEALAVAHGLKPDEYARFVALIGRTPTFTELGIVSAMWNEHCSYKSSRLHLRGLPTKAPWVIQGPGENAGVIDIGDGDACVFKMESHNHPSFIEPYQGAATGVGGILRDVFTMGARPVACLNFLRFGSPDHPKTRHLVAGVVAGIGGYGNSFGVPTVGGSVGFHRRYDGNILVNAMAVGVARADAIFYREGDRRRQSDRLSRLEDRPRRHPRRDHGLGRLRGGRRGEAPDRAGRRPVRREAAARGLPRADGLGRGRRHPGHGRGRPHLLGGRDGGQGRSRRRARPRRRPLPRDRHDRLRDDALREPGAHADGAEARAGSEGRRHLPQMGARLRRHRQDDRHEALRRQASGRGQGRPADQGARRRGAALRPPLERDRAVAAFSTRPRSSRRCRPTRRS